MPELLELVARGDAKAVPRLLSRYEALVWSIARRQLGVDAAEDVVQEVFIDLWRHAKRFDPARGSEQSFVSTIAHRRIVDHQRRRGRRAQTSELEEELLPTAEPAVPEVEVEDEAARVLTAIDELSPAQRRVLLMATVDGLTQARISAVTSIPLGTVKSHMRRGLARVRTSLGLDQNLPEERIPAPPAGEYPGETTS